MDTAQVNQNRALWDSQFFYLNILGLVALILFTIGFVIAFFPELKPILHRFCHQKPDRTLLLDGHLMGFCARCTGIYAGLSIMMLGLPLTLSVKRNILKQETTSLNSLTWLWLLEFWCYGIALIAVVRYGLKLDDMNVIRLIYGLHVGLAAGFLCWRYRLWMIKRGWS